MAQGRDLIGMDYLEAFPEIGPPLLKRMEEAFERRAPLAFEAFLEPYDMWIDLHAYPSDDSLTLFFKDVSERHRTQEQLLYLAHHDTLTGLVNRTVLHERLAKSLAAASAERQTALLFLDLDGFKSVNDSLGHSAGDRVLIEVSKRLKERLREGDIVANPCPSMRCRKRSHG